MIEHAFLIDIVVDRSSSKGRARGVELLVDDALRRLGARLAVAKGDRVQQGDVLGTVE